MTINPERLLNWPFEDVVQTYTTRDSMFYSLSMGLGGDPMDRQQLRYVYEKDLQAFPTMALVLGYTGSFARHPDSGINYTKVVDGERLLTVHRPLPATATIRGREKITSVIDKGEGRGALIYYQRTLKDDQTGELLATIASTLFARADGGFGGPSGPTKPTVKVPETKPDIVVDLPTLPQAALFYRLNGDYNPLHADPDVATTAGFPRPILHGLCSYAVAAHAVVKSCCDYDASRLTRFGTRFTSPVYPGETISVEIWRENKEILFCAWVRSRNVKVLDGGVATIA